MNFQFGDKVIVKGLSIVGTNYIGREGTVVSSYSNNEVEVEMNDGYKLLMRPSDLELIEPKKTKNQRITALEKEVESLKSVLAEILEIKKPTEIMKAIPSTDEEIIEFEGRKYRKIERMATVGDVVIPTTSTHHIKAGQMYKVTGYGSLGPEIGREAWVYQNGRTTENVEVYELIEQPKSANELRAQIIEKAKKFVEEHTTPNSIIREWKDKGAISWNGRGVIPKFRVNVESRTVVLTLIGAETPKKYAKEYAKCNPSDVFNEHIGKAIALGRALGLDVSEFEQAVQPDEVVKGTEVFYRRDGYASTFTQIVESVGDVEMANQDLNVKDDKGWSCKIINDTNAQYEEVIK